MRARFAVPVLFAAVALVGCESSQVTTPLTRVDAPISAITSGDLDGEAHPAVTMLIMREASTHFFFRCTGTFLNATTILTAGHCTGAPGEFDRMYVTPGSDLSAGFPVVIAASSWESHPLFSQAFFFLHDVGVVKIPEPGVVLPAEAYGVLPVAGQLDGLKENSQTVFTAVGYGIQKINPAKVEEVLIRMFASPRLMKINDPMKTGDFSMLLSNNAATGGTCFGDSGGPNYVGTSNVIGGVTSFSLSNYCTKSGGGVFRLDKADVLSFVNAHLP